MGGFYYFKVPNIGQVVLYSVIYQETTWKEDLYMRDVRYGIIAVDFDGTLCRDCYPEIGEANVPLIKYLKNQRKRGTKLILWTCRAGEKLNEAVEFCFRQGIVFDAVNENLPEIIELYGNDSRKISADLYIDDRSMNWEYEDLKFRSAY